MKNQTSTLTAELIDTLSSPPRIRLNFGSVAVAEWPVPDEDHEFVTIVPGYAPPTEEGIREYVDTFVAGKLAALLKNGSA